MARLSKPNHYKNSFEDNKNKLNKAWVSIKEIININKKITQQIRNINNNENFITEKKQIANTFNHFFCIIPKQIEKGIIPTQKTYDEFLTNPIEQSFKFDLTSDEEIITYIKTLKNNKSNGPFSISNKLFIKFKKPFSTPFSLLLNLTFTKGKFPDILKIGNIFPIHKKNCKTDINNYRPISLLSNISKIIEKIVHDRLYMYLEKNNIFYKYQFGFRANHSTNHALTEITEQIRNACDKGLYTGVYLDLQKAFDTVNQNILLPKLKHYGIKGTSFDWFKSFMIGFNTECLVLYFLLFS